MEEIVEIQGRFRWRVVISNLSKEGLGISSPGGQLFVRNRHEGDAPGAIVQAYRRGHLFVLLHDASIFENPADTGLDLVSGTDADAVRPVVQSWHRAVKGRWNRGVLSDGFHQHTNFQISFSLSDRIWQGQRFTHSEVFNLEAFNDAASIRHDLI